MNDGTTLTPGLADLADRLRKTAVLLGLKVRDRVDLVSTTFNGGSINSTSLSLTDLPAEAYAIQIDRFNIVLSVLPDVPAMEAVLETLRRCRNQCVIARSYLNSNEPLDLQLMLLGPRASERQTEWRSLALMVERDDRVARKLAWLRPEDPQQDEESFANFQKRTFLARPWVHDEGQFDDAELDRLGGTGATTPGLPRAITDEWERIALNENKSPDDIVTALIKVWERRQQL